jgi:hypothetical protein
MERAFQATWTELATSLLRLAVRLRATVAEGSSDRPPEH